ncbi:MAG: leucine-rich repeat domain-containing protein [Bacteroidaceae bacterium]|nr:leucine-rich repeat domain-containing protein [Bacteroidaceae bacterium]
MNKKLLALAATGLLYATGVSAHDFEVDGIYYNITSNWWDSNTVEVTYQGDNYWDIEEYSGAVSIPATVTYDGQEYSVTNIGYEAFAYCYSLTSVQIPYSVTSIDSWAFESCSNLSYVSIPNSVTSIGGCAFYSCSGLSYVAIPNSVTSIGDGAFKYCSGLNYVAIPNSVTNIESQAFYGCSGLSYMYIPNSVTYIGGGAFAECFNLSLLVVAGDNPVYDSRENCNAIIETSSNTLVAGTASSVIPYGVDRIGDYAFQSCGLTSIAIPESVTSIGDYAFQSCGLTSIEIPESVTSIGECAFQSCGLTSIAIPESVTSIGYGTFEYCSNLTSVVIPNSVTSIESRTFAGAGLTSVEFPNSVISIGEQSFSGCQNLTSVEIPNSLTSIGNGAFSNCENLSSIVVAEDNEVYDSRGGCNAIIESATNAIIAACKTTTIPEGITSIADYAFSNHTGLTSIDIPNTVTSIGYEAFYNCYNLTSVTIPNSVVSIGGNAFAYCDGLTSVEIPNSVTSIGGCAFYDCDGLTSVVITNSVTSIGERAFAGSSLASIVVAEGNTVYDSRQGCNAIIESASNTLIVGCQSTTIPNGVTRIGNNAFYDCDGLTALNIPYTVTSIGGCAFQYCDGLTAIEIPNSVTNLGWEAFYNCQNLTSVTIPNSVTDIEGYAFAYCYNLTSVTSNIPADKLFPVYVFDGVDKTNCTLYVPYGAQATYSYTDGWDGFANIIEMEAPSYDLTVSSAGYATLYLDYTAQIPEGVSVYTANEVEGNLLKMELVEGVLPANTGVVVKASAGTYTFTYSDTYAPEITDNLFKGSATYEYVDVASTQTAFVLSKVDGEVGMYPAKLTDGRFLNNANKAYLLLTTKLGVSDEELDTSVGGSQLSLRFDFGGTTGVDKVQTESGADAVIYDLYGRKVNKATTPGFYIINNKKVWVK